MTQHTAAGDSAWPSRTLVVFGCHRDDVVLRSNVATFRLNNPGVATLMCTYDAPVAGADIELFDSWPSGDRWRDCDYFLYEARERHPTYDWYVFLEWDCYFNASLGEVYGQPETDLVLTDVRDTRSKWSWAGRLQLLPDELRLHFLGTVPMCGVLVRGALLDRVAAFQPWPHSAVSEVRLPTIASFLGASYARMRSRHARFRVRPTYYLPLGRGAFHPVKSVAPSYWNKLASLFRHHD